MKKNKLAVILKQEGFMDGLVDRRLLSERVPNPTLRRSLLSLQQAVDDITGPTSLARKALESIPTKAQRAAEFVETEEDADLLIADVQEAHREITRLSEHLQKILNAYRTRFV